jgi:hypothetical protein
MRPSHWDTEQMPRGAPSERTFEQKTTKSESLVTAPMEIMVD